MAGFLGRLRSALSVRTVARQVFVLQAAIVVLLVVAAVVTVFLQVRHDSEREARNRSLAVAETFAHAPGVAEALQSPDPSAVLQPRAEAACKASGVDFIVVMSTDGVRYAHPDPTQIGKHYIGRISPAVAGGVVQETYAGTLGPSVRAVVPVKDAQGKVVGLVAAGVTLKKVSGVVEQQLPMLLGSAVVALAIATAGTALVSRRLKRQTHGLEPAEMTRMYEHHDAVLHAVREGVLIMDGNGRIALANDEARRLLGLGPDAEGGSPLDLDIGRDLARLFASGRNATDEVHPAQGRLLAVSQRSTDRDGGPPGSVATLRDTTELQALTGRADMAQERLKLLFDAGLEVGTGLDVAHTAQELANFAVPRFADFVTVDLADPVLRGGEPPPNGEDMRRVGFQGVRQGTPLHGPGQLIRFAPDTPQAAGFGTGEAVLDADLTAFAGWQEQDPERARRIVESGIHSMLAAPLRARGVNMGVATFWRSGRRPPFEPDDVSLAEELVARAAVSIDNARRYTREHGMAVTLQRSLLPRALPDQNALDVAYAYLPALASQGGVGGDWFDVIPLPGARVALIVGDVVGHGLHAAATMGRLRTAVHNFSTLDVPPDELLWHLDELVSRIDQDESGDGEGPPVTGATCLYAVYDPGTGVCTLSRAGHLAPAVIRPDGGAEILDVPGGPPLGLGGQLPFEATSLRLDEGSSLVLYTDGLVEDQDRDIDECLERLRGTLAGAARTPEEICRSVLRELVPDRPRDDIVLVVARTRLLPADRTAAWEVPADPEAVGRVRAAATRTLEEWGLEDVAFTTELILSELVTNAIRHAGCPIHVRLIRDRSLICEVSDGSSTAPHLRRAATTDEGGRGLFLVAQFAERWGTRYTPEGKVIWTEQPLGDEMTAGSGGSSGFGEPAVSG
ncbi:SpoIIE family protein phosphatase/ATP-binding protein [Streptomyces brasiliensis]|uniref:protein-serine/threonine phosphatase n=1 Tax=Streptomyces brasiliensis TaxID=1954 RepID=A0A917KL74_9ACTN|nr:SpoIIE family protein phosphatase/ATP-binding protein [Streptomyces brasiliensis]GGJ15938.1 histidine kinase [Streptomyces brasiliensis]